jgi:hypothetical protein
VKTILIRVFGVFGFVPAGRHKNASQRLAALAQDRDDWKKRATKAVRRERALEEQIHDLEKQLRKQGRRFTVVTDRRTVELAAMQEQVAEAQRALALTREHLMAIEVKLEILEGAANVLDARTRAQISGSTAGSAARTSVSA